MEVRKMGSRDLAKSAVWVVAAALLLAAGLTLVGRASAAVRGSGAAAAPRELSSLRSPARHRAVRRLERSLGVVTGTIAPDGNPVNVTISNAGDTAALTFNETAGHYIFLEYTGSDFYYWSTVTVYNPDGTQLASGPYGGQYVDRTLLSQTGTYTITLAPYSTTPTGTATFTLFDVPADYTGTVSIGGAASSVVISTPGQRGYLTFDGTAGTRIFTVFGGGFYYYSNVVIVNPDGTTLQSANFGNGYIDTTTLPQTGTYKLWLYPYEAPGLNSQTGQTTFQLIQVPPDDAGTIALGGQATMTIGTQGQRAYRTFYGQAGTPISATWNDSFYYYSRFYVYKPDGSELFDQVFGADGFASVTLPVDGVYKLYLG
jgi:hypothetical protein